MGMNEEQLRAHLRAALARIAARIEDLRARIDTESRALQASLSAEVAALQSDLTALEAEVDAAGPDALARQIAAQIEDLRAKGDAAYSLLQGGMSFQLDPTDAEIRRLEVVAATASGDARTKIMARIDELRAALGSAHAGGMAADQTSHHGDALN